MLTIGHADDIWSFLPELPVPEPWNIDYGIPWNDKDFSRRILLEHLSPDHDKASRKPAIIDIHVEWIHRYVLKGKQSAVLDLGCGPGLYTSRLASKGHHCTGIDFSPASIEFARNDAARSKIETVYHLADIRQLPEFVFDTSRYDLILFVYGEFCTFQPDDAREILEKCRRALVPNGLMILELLTARAVYEMGVQPCYRHEVLKGVFGDSPYQCFEEYFWNIDTQTAIVRYRIVRKNDNQISMYHQTCQAWHSNTLLRLFDRTGFEILETYRHLGGIPDENDDDFLTFLLQPQKKSE